MFQNSSPRSARSKYPWTSPGGLALNNLPPPTNCFCLIFPDSGQGCSHDSHLGGTTFSFPSGHCPTAKPTRSRDALQICTSLQRRCVLAPTYAVMWKAINHPTPHFPQDTSHTEFLACLLLGPSSAAALELCLTSSTKHQAG